VNEVYFIHLPMKMEPIVSSETSAIRTQTPENYPKRNNLQIDVICFTISLFNAQHVSDVNTSILRGLRLIC